MTVNELTFFPVTGNFNTGLDGSLETFDATVVLTPRVPPGFTALISDLDQGSGTGANAALAFPPQIAATTGGVLSTELLSNSAPVAEALAAAGISQLIYDVQFTKITLGYQIQNFSIIAPVDTSAVCLTDPDLTRYTYGGTVPVVSLPSGITPFGATLVSAANEAAAQALLGVSPTADYLGTVSSQSAMLALSALVGEFCYRSDLESFYYLIATPAATLANWVTAETVTAAGIGAVAVGGALGTPSSGTLTDCTGLPAATGITGTLPVGHGGIGAATLTGIAKGNGTSAFTAAVSGTDYMRAHWVNVLDHGADPTGVADSTTAFTNAIAALPSTGGWVYAPSGTYKISSTLTLNQSQRIRGDGRNTTVLSYTGTGQCIVAANTGVVTANDSPVGFEGLTIDGTSAGAGAIGLKIGNLYGSYADDFSIRNFNTTGAIGLYFDNSGSGTAACERNRFIASLEFNTTGVVFDTGSFDYSVFEFLVEVNANQSAMTLQNGAQLAGCRLSIRGNFAGASSNSGWVLGIDVGNTSGSSQIYNTDFAVAVESDGTGVGHQTVVMGSASGGQCSGTGGMEFLSAGTAFTGASIHQGSRFAVSVSDPVLGTMLAGDALAVQGGSQWAVFGSNTLVATSGMTINPQFADVQEWVAPNGAFTIAAIGSTSYLRARKLEMLWHQPVSGAAGVPTWPANVHLYGASGGLLSTANGAVDKILFTYYPSDNAWYGEVVPQTFPTLNQSTTGNAATATKLATARNINGVAFDGTAAITVADSTKVPNLVPTAVKTSAYTAAVNDLVIVDCTSGAVTVTAPAGVDGARFAVKREDATFNAAVVVTIARAGSDVFDAAATSTTLPLQGEVKTYQYKGSNSTWYAVSCDLALSVLDTRYLAAAGNAATATTAAACSGNAATATKLAAAVAINGISFDGSAAIITEQWIALASPYTLTSQTAAQQLFNATTNGAVTLPVGTYFFECEFGLSSMSATSGDFGFALGGTAAITTAWVADAAKPLAISTGGGPDVSFTNSNSNVNIAPANTNTTGAALIKGIMRVTAAGTVIPEVSLGTAAAAVVGAGSYFRIQQVSTSATATNVGAWS